MAQITTRQAAAMLGIDHRSVSRLAHRGVLQARKQGRDWLIERAEVERYARERRPPGWRRRPVEEPPAPGFAVRPEQPTTTQIATITTSGTQVMVSLPGPNDTLNTIIKSLGYTWNGAQFVWVKTLGATTGTAEDRVAELGHRLLLAGGAVVFPSEALAMRATTGTYDPEHHRWIVRHSATQVALRWPRDEDWFDRAKRLYGMAYEKPHVLVSVASYDEILDFAEQHQFRITEAARALLDAAKARYEAMLVVRPVAQPTTSEPPPTTDMQPPIAIDPEFLDDLDDDH